MYQHLRLLPLEDEDNAEEDRDLYGTETSAKYDARADNDVMLRSRRRDKSSGGCCAGIVVCRVRWLLVALIVGLLVLCLAVLLARYVPGASCSGSGGSTSPAKSKELQQEDPDKDFPYRSIRLPRSVVPTHYKMSLQVDLDKFSYSGSVEISLKAQETASFVVLHSNNLTIANCSLKGPASLHALRCIQGKKNEMIYVELSDELKSGSEALLSIDFSSALKPGLDGFYLSSYTNADNQKVNLATTHFEPTSARKAFPCFDEPDLKARFTLDITRAKDLISLTNMPIVKTTRLGENLVKDEFNTSVPMSTYLVAFVVCDFAKISGTTNAGKQVSVYTPPDQIGRAQFALEVAVKVLDHYDDFFGVKYPLPKLDMLAVPDFAAGAMENWGLITYRTTALLYDNQTSSAANQQRVATVVAHELAHQWFGNLVTMKWWNDLWLNEGFASFVEFIGVDYAKPQWKMYEQFYVQNTLVAQDLDSMLNSHPVLQPVANPAGIDALFDTISYAKGACIIYMAQSIIGEELVKKGLQAYLTGHQYGNAETADLWRALTQVSKDSLGGIDLGQVLDTWTQQMNYPLIRVGGAGPGGQVRLTQERYLQYTPANFSAAQQVKTSPHGYKWYVPVSYQTTAGKSGLTWLNKEDGSIALEDGDNILKVNINQTGFFRVTYDKEGWDRIIDTLQHDHTKLSATDRAGLLADAFNLARAGQLSVVTALELSRYLVQETEYVPFVAAADNLKYIWYRLLGHAAHDDLKQYMLSLVLPTVKLLGWKDDGPLLTRYLRSQVLSLAIKCGHQPSAQRALELFGTWMKDDKKPVPVNLKNLVYNAAVSLGTRAEWDFCLQRYKTERVPSEKRLLLSALCQTSDVQLIHRLLRYSQDPSIVRSQDVAVLLTYVSRNPVGAVPVWRFFRQHFDSFIHQNGPGSFGTREVIMSLARPFSSDFDYQEFSSFYASKVSVLEGETRVVDQALEVIAMNRDWMTQHFADTTAWLSEVVKTTKSEL